MSVSRDEAQQALKEVQAAQGRARSLQSYSDAAPGLITWGIVWLVCDLITQWAPHLPRVWLIGDIVGILGSIVFSALARRSRQQSLDRRVGFGYFSAFAFAIALLAIMWPVSFKQGHAFWGIFIGWFFVYGGLWVGTRIVIVGSVLALASLIGYFYIDAYYPLFMGVVGGGCLIVGGLWLRKA